MDPKERFIENAVKIIKNGSSKGAYYVLFTDIADSLSLDFYYGIEAAEEFLDKTEEFLSHLPGVRLCARLYADYFICLIEGEQDRDEKQMITGLDSAIRRFMKEQRHLYSSCKLKTVCGVCRVEDLCVEEAAARANFAHKEAKRKGSMKSVLYSSALRQQISRRYKSEEAINQAMEEGRFCFCLQPKVDLRTGEIIGAEALARYKDEQGNLVSPDEFIDIMEENGSVMDLDYMICRKVCMFMADRIKKGLPVVCTSINLSRLHVQNPETADNFHRISEQYAIAPELLEFELTETLFLKEYAEAKRLIGCLHAYGHQVSIDDFGSGYAGMNVWQELDFDVLKLDKKFLSGDPALKARNSVLVPNIINIGQRMDKPVLCEGVETKEQCSYLRQLGCTGAQGFYFSKPVDPESFYEEYEKRGGRYPLDIENDEEDKTESQSGKRGKKFWKAPSFDLIICIVLTLFFIGGSLGIIKSYQKFILKEFSGLVTENLRASTAGQKGAVLSKVIKIFGSLEASAAVIGQKEDPEFVQAYLDILNRNEEDVTFVYTEKAYFDQALKRSDTKPGDMEAIKKLMNKEKVISDVTYSKRMGDIYCIACGVPVISRDGEFLGAVRGVTDAAMLTGTDALENMQKEILWCFVTDGQGEIIPVKAEDEIWSGSLFTHLERRGVEEELLTQMRGMLLHPTGTAQSIQLGTRDGLPIFISETELGYNDWHLFVCIQASGIHSYVDAIVNKTILGTVLQTGIALIVCFGFLALIVRSQKRLSDEKKRYLLIEQFSDVVLFNYDCKKDVMRFTPNILKFARVHETIQKSFCEYIQNKFIYAGDRDIFENLLTGKMPEEKPEIRVRLLRPDKEQYFWCRLNCRYVYSGGELISIIGKMEDVDRKKKEEEELLRLAHMDELTGLYNRATLKRCVCRKLGPENSGLLFLIDVDKFKQINDSLGHTGGDRALSYIGSCIQKVFRTDDIKGRIGGDELMVFISDTDSKQVARQKAGRLAYYLATSSRQEYRNLTVSIGIARYPLDGNTYKTLFEAADFAMYTAKKRGGGRFAFYDEVQDEA